jgi:hypothetical protein
LCGVGD